MIKYYKTIIIGGGISGIGCATTLQNKKQDFCLISPNIGGRITESSTGAVEYGAYYAMSIYHNVSAFIQQGKKLKPSQVYFHQSKYSYSIFNYKLLSAPLQYLKLIYHLYKFKKQYELFKKKCILHPQPDSLRNNPYLWKLYNTSAQTFITSSNLQDIASNYLCQLIQSTTFTNIKKLNAFTFLQFSLPVIVPVYEIHFKKKRSRGSTPIFLDTRRSH